jgi:hypothetical protein
MAGQKNLAEHKMPEKGRSLSKLWEDPNADVKRTQREELQVQ